MHSWHDSFLASPFSCFTSSSFEFSSRRAKAFIGDIVSRGHDSSNGQSNSMQEIIIPAGKAGLIIGKGGETIKQLQVRRFYFVLDK